VLLEEWWKEHVTIYSTWSESLVPCQVCRGFSALHKVPALVLLVPLHFVLAIIILPLTALVREATLNKIQRYEVEGSWGGLVYWKWRTKDGIEMSCSWRGARMVGHQTCKKDALYEIASNLLAA
jgi:hypothetical protein